jgi:hypothetical protein
MVTLKAKSALKREHHQLEYEPPGLLVTTNKVIPMLGSRSRRFTIAKPVRGSSMN